MPRTIYVLCVDGDPDAAAVTAERLARANDRIDVVTATGQRGGLEALADGGVDCVVSGHDAPEMDGVEFLREVREEYGDLPFVLFTDEGDEDVAIEAIAADVTGYLRPGGPERYELLGRRIEEAVAASPVARSGYPRQKLERLNDASLELMEATTRGEVYELAIGAIDRILEFHTSAICEPQDGVFETMAARNLPEDIEPLDEGEGLLGAAYRDGESSVVGDIRETDVAEPLRETYRSALTVPIGDYGVFQAVSTDRDAFSEEDRQLTELLMNHVARTLQAVEYGRELREANERLRAILDNTTAIIYAKDLEGRYTLVNERFASVLDTDREEMLGKTDFEFLSEASAEAVRENDRRAIEAGRPVEVEERTVREGVERTYLSVKVPMFDDGGDPIGVCGISTDITERKERERELAYQQSLLEAVTETALDGILVVDEEREFVTHNERFAEMWGLPDEVLEDGEATLDAVAETVDDPEAFRRVLRNPDDPQPEDRDRIHLSDGRVFDRYTAPVTDGTDDYGRVWYFRDITDRIERMDALRERTEELERQNDRLDEFTSIVSHDLRNPLAIAKGRLKLALDEPGDGHVESALDAVTRMETLVEQTLTLASQGRTVAETEPVRLRAVAETCWGMVTTDSATLVVVDEATFRADRQRIQQVFENLFRNAVEHGSTSPDLQARQDAVEHGSTSPRSSPREDAVEHGSTGPDSQARQDAAQHAGEAVTVRVGTTDEGGIFVADDGPGIPADEREKVFEPGRTTSEEGTGFGLSIVAEIAEAHGWEVDIVESESRGTRVEFSGIELER